MNIPSEFQPRIKVEYPPGTPVPLEQWLMTEINHPDYLAINWCGYQVNNQYGKNKPAMQRLQRFINSLPKKSWFTYTQYDDSILSDISGLDIKVFGSGGGRIDYPLALVCKPHGVIKTERTIFASFTGSLTHKIRKDLLNMTFGDDYYISAKHYGIDDYCRIIAKSTFILCPRGYGETSFRICEALEQGAIPVYISDKFIIPDNRDFEEYGVLIDHSQLSDINRILRSITPEQIEAKRKAGEVVYKELYSFEGCKSVILRNI